MAAKWHVNPETGKAGPCRATKRPCKFSEEFHGENREHAISNYANSHEYTEVVFAISKNLRVEAERKAFFSYGDNSHNIAAASYALIHTSTGTVITDDCYVFDADGMSEEDEEEFYNDAAGYINNEEVMPQKITQVKDLSGFKMPVVVSSVGDVIDCNNVYAVDTRNKMIDFDKILNSDQAAKETAEKRGFLLWG